MMFQIVRAEDVRTTTSPSATMFTLASPTLGGTDEISLWRVALEAGSAGPAHMMDVEQIWTLTFGEARCEIEGLAQELRAGDTIRIASGVLRQFFAHTDAQFVVCGRSAARASVPGGGEPVAPPWIG